MALSFKKLTDTLPVWLAPGRGRDRDILICTMGRMVRNLEHRPFPGWSDAAGRAAVAEALLPALGGTTAFKGAFCAEMSKLNRQQRLMLLERKQLTPSMAARQDGCYILVASRRHMVAMVNEEEHLCVHATVPGLDAAKVLAQLDEIDGQLAEKVAFTASPEEGYLTSLPTETGEGLQLYAVLHMPALLRTDMIGRVRKGLEKLGLNLSPFYSESGEDAGAYFVIFTAAIRDGETEMETERFTRICKLLAQRESDMRRKISHDDETADAIYRAYALLRHSRLMDFKELVNLLSYIRLGFALGLLGPAETGEAEPATAADLEAAVLQLYNTTAPAHLRARHKDATDKTAAMRLRSEEAAGLMRRIQIITPQDSTF